MERAMTEEKRDLGEIQWKNCPHVSRDPERLSGAWCLGGKRLPVSTIFTNLAAGMTIAEVVEQFPGTKEEHIVDVLEFVTERLDATDSR